MLLIYNYDKKIDSVFNAVIKHITQLNVQYDTETDHMNNIAQQKLWDKKISMLMKDEE